MFFGGGEYYARNVSEKWSCYFACRYELFFAAVEIAHDASLQGKPLAVAGNEKEKRNYHNM